MKSLICFLGCFLSLFSIGQDIKINWGTLSKEEVQLKGLVTISNEQSIGLSVQKEGKGKKATWNGFLTSYNNLEQNKVVPLINNLEASYESLLKVGDRMYVVINVDTDNEVPDVYILEINKETLLTAGKPLKVGSFGSLYSPEILFHPYIISPDGNKLLFRGKVPKTKHTEEEYVLIQYDAHMKEEWRRSYRVKSAKDYLHSYNFLNDGRLICLLNERTEKRATDYKVSILVFDKNTQQPVQTLVVVNNATVTSMLVSGQSNDQYNIFGMYTKEYGVGHTGYYTASFNRANKSFDVKIAEEFSKTLLKKLDKLGQAYESSNLIGYSFSPVASLPKADGTIDHIMEFRSVDRTGHVTQFGRGRNSWTMKVPGQNYLNHSIIVINVGLAGKSRITYVPKWQCAGYQDRLANSFIIVPYKDKTLFFYNDWRKSIEYSNEDVKSMGCANNYKKTSFVMMTLHANGTFDRKILSENADQGFYPAISYFVRITDNKILLVGQNAQDEDDLALNVVGILEIK